MREFALFLSLGLHGAFIVFAVYGEQWFGVPEQEELIVVDAQIISAAELAALMAPDEPAPEPDPQPPESLASFQPSEPEPDVAEPEEAGLIEEPQVVEPPVEEVVSEPEEETPPPAVDAPYDAAPSVPSELAFNELASQDESADAAIRDALPQVRVAAPPDQAPQPDAEAADAVDRTPDLRPAEAPQQPEVAQRDVAPEPDQPDTPPQEEQAPEPTPDTVEPPKAPEVAVAPRRRPDPPKAETPRPQTPKPEENLLDRLARAVDGATTQPPRQQPRNTQRVRYSGPPVSRSEWGDIEFSVNRCFRHSYDGGGDVTVDLDIRLLIQLDQTGRLSAQPLLLQPVSAAGNRVPRDPRSLLPAQYVVYREALAALRACEPYKVPGAEKFEEWSEFAMTFGPQSRGAVER